MARLGPFAALAPPLAVAAVLAAGCRVDVDGAPCAGPGTASDCPDGQACGNDARCSARALACASSRCTPGDGHCTGSTAYRCSAADPVCGRWEGDDCGARGMECGTQGSDACECPAYAGTTLVADPSVSSLRGVPPFPTGQQDPPECRFGRLGDALAAATALAPAAATVRIAPEGEGAAFGEATGEEWPLLVASSVSLAGAAAAGPAIRGASGGPAVLEVEGTLEAVRVEAGGASAGVRVTGAGARLVAVEVSGAAGAALEVNVDAGPAAAVEVLGGAYVASAVGVWIRGGRVTVAPDPATASSAVAAENPGSTIVGGNAGDGVVIGGHGGRGLPLTGTEVIAVLERVAIEANGGAGVIVAGLPDSSAFRMAGCDVHRDGTGSPVPYGTGGRSAGGVLVSLGPGPKLDFIGNRLWSNAGDQLAFDSGVTWRIEAPACGPDTNVFACVAGSGCGGGTCAVSVAGGGSVQAAYTAWPSCPAYPFVTLNAVTGIEQCCTGGAGEPPAPTCP